MKAISGGVTAAQGFSAAGVHCGIRKNKTKKDLALILSDVQAAAACVYKLWNCSKKQNRVLFVERSGELHDVARLSTESVEPKGNQVLTGRQVT